MEITPENVTIVLMCELAVCAAFTVLGCLICKRRR